MTREEAIKILSTRDAHGVLCGYTSGVTEALDMAIEALSQVRCNDCKWNDDVIEVVRCKDCIHNTICSKSVQTTEHDKFTTTIGYKKIDFCSWAKMKGADNV